MVQVDPLVVASVVLENLPSFVILGGAWWISRRLALARDSQGLMLMSLGLLVKLAIDGAWYVVWWVYFGGIYEVFFLLEKGMNESQIGWTLYIMSLVDGAVAAASLSAMTIFMIYGARLTFRGRRGNDTSVTLS